MPFSPEQFFDLKSFSHRALFDHCEDIWEPLTRIQSFLKDTVLGRIEVDIPPGVYLDHPELISIGKGTLIEPGAYIRGPCLIGQNCVIRHGAYIRGDLITGDECVIGHATEVKHCIFLNRVRAGHFAYLGDSILGHDVNLGAGTKCANLRLDGGEIALRFEGRRYGTGMRKLGAIIGDGGQTGCNAVTNPGTLFGPGVVCYPCVNVGGVVLAGVIKAADKKDVH